MASHGVPRTSVAEKSEEARLRELDKIQEYRESVDELQAKVTAEEYTAETLALTSKILKRNPEYYTVWNHRRQVLSQGLFVRHRSDVSVNKGGVGHNIHTPTSSASSEACSHLIRSDLAFLVPLLREFPKCYWIWNYRLWLLEQSTVLLPRPVARGIWEEELALAGKMLARDCRNFHGWGYRRTVVERLESPALSPEDPEGTGRGRGKSMVEDEVAYTRRMIGTNLSNFSAWHYRTTLIPRLLDERGADSVTRRRFMDDEFKLITNALYTDTDDQSLWFYHEWLMSNYTSPPSTHSVIQDLSRSELRSHVQKQIMTLVDMLDGAEDCKWVYEALLRYTLVLEAVKQHQQQNDIEFINEQHGDAGAPKTEADQHYEQARRWLAELRRIDPLRKGRWDDLGLSLGSDAQHQSSESPTLSS